MAAPPFPPPPPDARGLQLHGSLLTSDAAAPWAFAHAYLDHLAAWLHCLHPAAADLCEEAAVETVYGLLADPLRFDPQGGKSLLNYLRMAARCDLLNLFRREARHAHETLDENSVELHAVAGKYQGRDDDPLQALCDLEDEAARQDFLRGWRGSLGGPDQAVFDLMRAGERKNEAFAAALGVGGLPPEEQEAEVKRAKDRIKARGKRLKENP